MKLIAVNEKLMKRYTAVDNQVLLKGKRPTALVVRLMFRGNYHDFAVPFRSNISPASSKDEYFALPPRKKTKPKHHHGLHYIKMFPVSKQFYERYRIEGDIASNMYLAIINKHEKQIVDECQAYLTKYECGTCPRFCTNLDVLIEVLNQAKDV